MSAQTMSRRQFFRQAAGCTALAGIVGTYGYARWVEPHWVEVVERDLPIGHLPEALIGRRLIQLSDLHVGDEVDDAYLIDAFRRVAQMQPDILVKGADWPADQIVGRDTVEARGGRVVRVPVEQGYSTTTILERVTRVP